MNFQIGDIALIPALVGIVQMFLMMGLPKKYAPLLSTILGIVLGIFYVTPGDIKMGILLGIVMGLSSVGLYSSTKNTIEIKKGNKNTHLDEKDI